MVMFSNPAVAAVFDAYPVAVREKMLFLRQLVFTTAAGMPEVGAVVESLKWGEPSYLAKSGSAVRMDWKLKRPDRYALYFNCQTRLVDTFKEIHGDALAFEGNRAVVFSLDGKLPVATVRHCLALALTYQRRKHFPMLGV